MCSVLSGAQPILAEASLMPKPTNNAPTPLDKPADKRRLLRKACAKWAPPKISADKYNALNTITMLLKIKNGTAGVA